MNSAYPEFWKEKSKIEVKYQTPETRLCYWKLDHAVFNNRESLDT